MERQALLGTARPKPSTHFFYILNEHVMLRVGFGSSHEVVLHALDIPAQELNDRQVIVGQAGHGISQMNGAPRVTFRFIEPSRSITRARKIEVRRVMITHSLQNGLSCVNVFQVVRLNAAMLIKPFAEDLGRLLVRIKWRFEFLKVFPKENFRVQPAIIDRFLKVQSPRTDAQTAKNVLMGQSSVEEAEGLRECLLGLTAIAEHHEETHL